MTEDFSDIINLPHHQSRRHPQMSMKERAAQFAPFAALTGYGSAISEVARLTEEQVPLGDDDNDRLNRLVTHIADRISEQPSVTIVYFKPDSRKQGGSYETITGRLKRIDDYEQQLVMLDGTAIPFENIMDISQNIDFEL